MSCVTLDVWHSIDALNLHLELAVPIRGVYRGRTTIRGRTTVHHPYIDLDHITSTIVLCDVYSYRSTSTVVLICNSNSLDTSTHTDNLFSNSSCSCLSCMCLFSCLGFFIVFSRGMYNRGECFLLILVFFFYLVCGAFSKYREHVECWYISLDFYA